MGIDEARGECDSCSGGITVGNNIYCEDCYDPSSIEKLEKKVAELEKALSDIEEERDSLLEAAKGAKEVTENNDPQAIILKALREEKALLYESRR